MAKILIVEDHTMSRQVLVTLFSYTEHSIIEATDGAAALVLAHKELPDLIITDLLMPNMDGIEFISHLRGSGLFSNTPVIFYTASFHWSENIHLEETYGPCKVILKPSDPDLILETVNNFLNFQGKGSIRSTINTATINFSKSTLSNSVGLKLPIMMDFSYSLVAQRNPEQLLSTFTRYLKQILNCKQAFLSIQNGSGMTCYYLGDVENWPVHSIAHLNLPMDIIEPIVSMRSIVRWQKNIASTFEINQQGFASPFESLFIAPFSTPTHYYGWICLIDKLNSENFSPGDEEIALTLTSQTALAYENIMMVEELRKSDEAKSLFIANLSHELRTPLNILLSSTQLLNSYLQYDSELCRGKISKKVGMQVQNCNRLLRLVNNFIDIAKIDSGYFDLNFVKCNIVEIVEAITISVVEYANIKKINMIFDTDEENIPLYCDLDSIERIVLNLLSNAIKFTPEGGTIYVQLYRNNGSAQIKVRDTGIGITKDKYDIIFEKFRQVENLMTRNNEGSGIGLSLVKLLTEMHGGRVYVSSVYQKGSEFVVELPLCSKLENSISNDSINNLTDGVVKRIQVEFSDIYW